MTAATPPGVPTRAAALRLLEAVLRRGLPLESALDAAARGLERADDRAHAHAIAAEVLRRLPDLDALIDSATAKPLAHDAKARMVLRIALAQALALNTPPHAAIATALPLVDGGPRRLVHGVFGALMRRGVHLPVPPQLLPAVAERWDAAWGPAMVAAAAEASAVQPPLDVSLKNPAETQSWAEQLGGVSLAPGHVRLPAGGRVPALPGYDEGAWWVQDLSASLPARLIGAGEGRTVLDLCAAPGGKTMQLAAAGWQATAVDLSEARLARLSENLARTGLEAKLVVGDALTFSASTPADAVLLDAPCSATGIFRRHPDVLHRARPRAIAGMAERQAAMLARAASWVKPGGTLVYAVCSLEPEEGEAVAQGFAASHRGFVPDPVRDDELPAGFAPDAEGRVRVLPGTLAAEGGADGFFVARFRRAD
ncbi:RsmB/NOP family class I SAM-dependent RNA methyltransferase [Sphingomonas nostoxanthinifaciens]|uniref:RsmB/NOP family class I SAM-dependent RNA methyltransferase n=1 Tax=Sphingomonas nostoxanthinifaciens TaxID=2872652 RepID=UPI001CC20D20|nr:RsmB/NOP family class I SAM-dependent RNA methyltransferase [Sphingomonas nostoxanthinifaciens]UAK24544.1 RsmB/NOP family class I SAM-dependent RNA methyltransferase [Sphingomonas nostoxanthinifaciens]